ncbi:testicular acid phosphatase homolog [Trichonephila inaurata madagascariensis]|uniref:acid phosphatase n=1 Tax=Trichonephila inaurata madagascariensis TaxID=2747483 RepID=A0A8X6XQZ9_9ARAC|nr:testicular acid phosphatase homolog [Trichonephila inaurata madagascariensis]
MLIWLLFLACIFRGCQGIAEEDSTLLFLQVIFRHGDRAPIKLYPNDPNTEEAWPEGLGQLTMLGKKQNYEVGKYLRFLYEDFITSDPNEVMVNSSESTRCMMSALAIVASLYSPEGRWKFREDIDWQPILVNYLPNEIDKYLSFQSICPQAALETFKVMKSKEVQEYLKKHKTCDKWNTFLLYDTLFIEKKYNLTIPKEVEPYWNEFEEFALTAFQWAYGCPEIVRLRAGPLLQNIIENMNRKIAGDMPKRKVQMYCSHDVIISALLLAMNITDVPRPPYAATLLIELHQMSNDTKSVRLFYFNSTDPEQEIDEPHLLYLDGCSEFCPLQHFIESTRHMIPEDWSKECLFGDISLSDQCV